MRTRSSRMITVAGLLLVGLAAGAGCSTDPPRAVPAGATPPVAGLPPDTPGVVPPPTPVQPKPAPPCTLTPQAAPTGPADVEVSVRADRGPNGAAELAVVDRKLLGMNIADWLPADYAPVPDPTFLALLDALRPGVLRWPAGHRSQEYLWERGGGPQSGEWTLTAAHLEAFLALAKAVNAEPLLGINVKRGSPGVAADLVSYVNKERGHGVQWFQVVNEPDLTDGIIPSPEAYAAQLIAFSAAMRAVDPTIRIVAPELLTGAHVGGLHGKVDWMAPILTRAGNQIDGISWHYYPLDSAQASPTSGATLTLGHLFQETASDWRPAGLAFADEIMPALATLRKAHAPQAGIWVTEFAEDPGPAAGAGISDTIAGALWVGDALGRYARYQPSAVMRWLFKGSSTHAYGLLDGQNVPRPAYGTYWLFAHHVGRRFVDASTSALTSVSVHAALRDDGALTLLLVNKTTTPRRVKVSLSGFDACAADEHTLTGASYASTTFQINDVSLTAGTAQAGIAPRSLPPSRLFETELPATSVRVIAYRH